MIEIALNDFVRRQTADSKFSHYEGDMNHLLLMINENFDKARPGDKPGSFLISVLPEGFFCGVVEVTSETELKTTFEPRREGEASHLQTVAVGATKAAAKQVDLIIYSRESLGKDATTDDADYELVMIRACAVEGEEPMTPMAMARNFLELEGGTKADYTAEEFALAIVHWSTRVMAG